MLFLENALIFPAPRYPSGNWEHPFEDIFFESKDGTKLHGLFVDHPNPKAHLIFFHGNGEHVANSIDLLENYRDDFQATVFAFDYRGYGRSEGKPHEKGVLADGHAAHKWFTDKAGVGPNEIVLIGRSLGGAVAVDLAAEYGARALVLERTFTKMPDVAARLYPILPIRFLMKTQLDSQSKIHKYDGPLLQSHGTRDEIVPYDLGQKLFETATTQHKEFYADEGGGHNDAYSREYWTKLTEFMHNLEE